MVFMSYVISKKYDLLLGDMPNIKMRTRGGRIFWKTVKDKNDLKLQINRLTDHARILDEENNRIAWGSYDAMENKFERLTREEYLEAGDIIGVKRAGGIYEHYGVYIGNDEVVHYAGNEEDFGGEIRVHIAPMSEFLNHAKGFFVLDFPDEYGIPTKINALGETSILNLDGINVLEELTTEEEYHLYSPEETVKRALGRLGENKYSLAFNNCEHFAIWCKTGISESHQVNRVLENLITPLSVLVR